MIQYDKIKNIKINLEENNTLVLPPLTLLKHRFIPFTKEQSEEYRLKSKYNKGLSYFANVGVLKSDKEMVESLALYFNNLNLEQIKLGKNKFGSNSFGTKDMYLNTNSMDCYNDWVVWNAEQKNAEYGIKLIDLQGNELKPQDFKAGDLVQLVVRFYAINKISNWSTFSLQKVIKFMDGELLKEFSYKAKELDNPFI